jgi:hypothetical protein
LDWIWFVGVSFGFALVLVRVCFGLDLVCLGLLWVGFGSVRVCFGFALVCLGLLWVGFGLVWARSGFALVRVSIALVSEGSASD